MIKKYLGYQRGFTLIEMVIVIVVIGILMGLAFQGVSSMQQNARDTRRVADLHRVRGQLELFFGRCGHYPLVVSTATTCGATPSSTAGGNNELSWDDLRTRLEGDSATVPGVVGSGEVPNDPLRGRNYGYRVHGNGLSYVIFAQTERIGFNRAVTGANVLGQNCDERYCLRN